MILQKKLIIIICSIQWFNLTNILLVKSPPLTFQIGRYIYKCLFVAFLFIYLIIIRLYITLLRRIRQTNKAVKWTWYTKSFNNFSIIKTLFSVIRCVLNQNNNNPFKILFLWCVAQHSKTGSKMTHCFYFFHNIYLFDMQL